MNKLELRKKRKEDYKVLPVRLRLAYGYGSLSAFFPDIFPGEALSVRDVLDLYDQCLTFEDAEAVALLSETYDINGFMKTDQMYHCEITALPDRLGWYEKKLMLRRQKDEKDRGYPARRYGGRVYRKWFVQKTDGTWYLSARSTIYSMSHDHISLLKQFINDLPDNFDDRVITEQYEILLKLPVHELRMIILFYLRFLLQQKFPIEDYEALELGEIPIEQ